MKKLLVLALSVVLMLSFAGCGQKATNEGANNAEEPKKTEQTQISKEDMTGLAATAFEIEGKSYSFPCDLSALKDNGWEFTFEGSEGDLKDIKVEPNNGYITWESMSLNGEKKIGSLSFYNLTDKETTMDKCQLIGIKLWGDVQTSSSEAKCKFKLFGELDESLTYEDVIRVMGSKADEANNEFFRISDGYKAEKAGTESFSLMYFAKEGKTKYNYTFNFNKDGSLCYLTIEIPTSMMNFE